MSFCPLQTGAAAKVGRNFVRHSAVARHSIAMSWNIVHAIRMRGREPSSIFGIGPEHKMLVPSIIDVGLTEGRSLADPVPHSPHSAVAHSERLELELLHAVENMETVHMGPIFPCGVNTPDD